MWGTGRGTGSGMGRGMCAGIGTYVTNIVGWVGGQKKLTDNGDM